MKTYASADILYSGLLDLLFPLTCRTYDKVSIFPVNTFAVSHNGFFHNTWLVRHYLLVSINLGLN